MIRITDADEQRVPHYGPNNEYLGELTDYQNINLRCQISEQNAEGYYLIFDGQKIFIEPDGSLDTWPTGLYDATQLALGRLLESRMNRIKQKSID